MMKYFFAISLAAAILVATACDSTQPKHSGTLTAVVDSPNGAEGAAVINVRDPVDSFTAVEGTSLYQTPTPTGTHIILVRLTPGELSMKVNVPDVSSLPHFFVIEVADGENKIRPTPSDYHVSFLR